MTEPQRTLDNFAQSRSDENISENGNSGSREPSEVSEESLDSGSVSPDDPVVPEENHEKNKKSSDSAQSESHLRSGSKLQFGKDPDEIDIPCRWARRHIAHRSANTLKNKALSETSIGSYVSALREYVEFVEDHDRDVLTAEFDLFEEYLLYCIEVGRRTGTVIGRVSKIRGLYEHIELNEEVNASISSLEFGQIQREAIEELTPEDIKREDLSRNELEKLFDGMKRERDRLMAIVGAETGFRNSDIRNIRMEDVDFKEPEIFAKDPKYSKPYSVPISEELALELEIWIETAREANYGHHESKYLFPSERSVKIESNTGLGGIIREAADRAGIQDVIGRTDIESEYMKREKTRLTWNRVTPHVLRHSFITILENEDVSLEYRRLLANHSSTETTRQYSHGKKDLLKQAQERVNLRY